MTAADELAAGFDPSAGSSAARLRGAAAAVASERSGVDLAVESATARAAALAGAYATVLAATRAGDLGQAREWLLVREFKPVTRFTHPSAASSVAIASLADGVVPRARAVRSIRGDLLDTYEALLRSSLADTGDALRAGFPEKAAGSAATARGYWWILRDTFIGQRERPPRRGSIAPSSALSAPPGQDSRRRPRRRQRQSGTTCSRSARRRSRPPSRRAVPAS